MLSKILLLLVNDNETDRSVFMHILSVTEADIREAATGEEALKLLNKEIFDCIILDYQLPDCNSATLIKIIREMGFTIPIVVTTNCGDELIAVEMMKAGAQDYVPKDKAPELLIRAITNAIELKKTSVQSDYYKNFYDNAPIGFFSESKLTRKFVKANPAFLKMINVGSLEDLEKIEAYDIIDPDVKAEIHKEIEKNGFVRELEVPVRTMDGQPRWWLSNVTFCTQKCAKEGGKCLPTCPGNGCIEASVIDITAKKHLELQLEELKAKELDSLKEIQAAIDIRLKEFDLNLI
jgi:CheY-like chemotaxis protein